MLTYHESELNEEESHPLYSFPNTMLSNVNVLRALVVAGVMGQISTTLVVKRQKSNVLNITKLPQQSAPPNGVPKSICEGHVLSLRKGEHNGRLVAVFPRDNTGTKSKQETSIGAAIVKLLRPKIVRMSREGNIVASESDR